MTNKVFAAWTRAIALCGMGAAAYFSGGARELPAEAVAHWEADGAVIHANFEIVGTQTGSDFLWAALYIAARTSLYSIRTKTAGR